MLPFHFVSIVVVEGNIFLNVVILLSTIYVYIVATYSFNFFSTHVTRHMTYFFVEPN